MTRRPPDRRRWNIENRDGLFVVPDSADPGPNPTPLDARGDNASDVSTIGHGRRDGGLMSQDEQRRMAERLRRFREASAQDERDNLGMSYRDRIRERDRLGPIDVDGGGEGNDATPFPEPGVQNDGRPIDPREPGAGVAPLQGDPAWRDRIPGRPPPGRPANAPTFPEYDEPMYQPTRARSPPRWLEPEHDEPTYRPPRPRSPPTWLDPRGREPTTAGPLVPYRPVYREPPRSPSSSRSSSSSRGYVGLGGRDLAPVVRRHPGGAVVRDQETGERMYAGRFGVRRDPRLRRR